MSTDLLARVPEWVREAEEHEEKARALRQMVDAVRVLNGDAARLFGIDAMTDARTNQYAPADGPRGREAVRRITADSPGLWRLRDIKAKVKENGWPSSPSAIETTVKRLHADGEAVWVSKGVYKFGSQVTHEAAARSTPEAIGSESP